MIKYQGGGGGGAKILQGGGGNAPPRPLLKETLTEEGGHLSQRLVCLLYNYLDS